MVRGWLLAIAMLSACTDEQEPVQRTSGEQCATAVDLYYAAGCTYWVDAGGGQSVPVPANAAARMCGATSESADCAYAAEALLTCSRRAGAPSCGCGDQLATLLWCR